MKEKSDESRLMLYSSLTSVVVVVARVASGGWRYVEEHNC